MLCAIDICNLLIFQRPSLKLLLACFHSLVQAKILLALESIEQQLAQALVEVVSCALHDLFEEVGLCGTKAALPFFFFKVGV